MKDHVPPLRGNVPELVWDQLKIIAAQEASSGRDPAVETCIEHVQAVIGKLAGRPDILPVEVVRFYAEELQARIEAILKTALTDTDPR